MLRVVLISVGVVTAAVTSWFVNRKFFTPKAAAAPDVIGWPRLYQPGARRKRTRRIGVSPAIGV